MLTGRRLPVTRSSCYGLDRFRHLLLLDGAEGGGFANGPSCVCNLLEADRCFRPAFLVF